MVAETERTKRMSDALLQHADKVVSKPQFSSRQVEDDDLSVPESLRSVPVDGQALLRSRPGVLDENLLKVQKLLEDASKSGVLACALEAVVAEERAAHVQPLLETACSSDALVSALAPVLAACLPAQVASGVEDDGIIDDSAQELQTMLRKALQSGELVRTLESLISTEEKAEAARVIQKTARKRQETNRYAAIRAKRPRPAPDQPKPPPVELIMEVFKLCDLNEDGVVDEQEMFRFIQCLDYPGDEQEWAMEYKLLCEYHKWTPLPGLNFECFVKILDDPNDNYMCDRETLVRVIGDLKSQEPYDALERSSPKASKAGTPGKRPPASAVTAIEVPVDFKVEGLDYARLMARDALREEFICTIREVITLHFELEPNAVGEFMLASGSVLVHTSIRTDSQEQARQVQQALDPEVLRQAFAEAIQTTPGIEAVRNGPITATNVHIGEPFDSPIARTSPPQVDMTPPVSPERPNNFSDEDGPMDLDNNFLAQEYAASPGGNSTAVWTPMSYDMGSSSPTPARLAFLEANRGGDGRLRRWPSTRNYAGRVRSGLAEFKAEMLMREQSLAGAWRNSLDPNWTGRIAIHEFCDACRAIGHRGNKKRLWADLDVDKAGTITLNELAWDEAELLGKLNGSITARYDTIKAATREWGMVGPKRFHHADFLRLMTTNRLVNSKGDADRLFRMLCSCPMGGGSAAFLGNLGPELRDVAPAVTSREFAWLAKMAPTLPRPAVGRIMPGSITKESPSTATPGGPSLGPSPDFSSVNFSPTSPSGRSSKAEMSPLADSEFDLKSEGTLAQKEEDIFETLYRQAMEHHQYRKELTEHKYVSQDSRKMDNRFLFERLYTHAKDRAKRQEEKVNQYMQQLRKEFNHGLEPKVHDSESLNRLLRPKKRFDKVRTGEDDLTCARQQRLWALLSTEQLMMECEKLADALNAEQEEVERQALAQGVEYHWMRLDWKSKGKSREELINFLEEADARSKLPDRPTPAQSQKLFEDYDRREDHLATMQAASKAAFDQKLKESFKCDLHGDNPHKTCRLCKRWQLIQTGEEVQRENSCSRLYSHALKQTQGKHQRHTQKFKSLLHDGDRFGLLHGRDFVSAKLALTDLFGEDPRWNLMRGVFKDKLIVGAIEEYTKKREAYEKSGKEWRKSTHVNPDTFYRLFLDSYQKDASHDERERVKHMAEIDWLKEASIHKGAEGDGHVFERLYTNDPKLRQALPLESLKQLSGKPDAEQWNHYRWSEPVDACIVCNKSTYAAYVDAVESCLVCDDCVDAHHAHKRAIEMEDLVGKRVWVSWKETYFHRATVLDQTPEGTYHVIYEDDQKHEVVPRSRIKVPDNKHPQYEPGYKPRKLGIPAARREHKTGRRRREPNDTASQSVLDPSCQQVLLFSFPDVAWPPPNYFESELRYSLELLGAPSMAKMKVRLRQMGVDKGVTAEISGSDEKIQAFQNVRLEELKIAGQAVAEVWAQEREEEPMADFADFINLRFKNLKDAFTTFDASGTSTVSLSEFVDVCRLEHFDGNAKFVWHALNNGTGVLTYNDFKQLAPYVNNKALITAQYKADMEMLTGEQPLPPLEDFALFISEIFPDLNTAWVHFEQAGQFKEASRRGTLSFSEFLTACSGIGYQGDPKGVFRELDRAKNSSISKADFNLLGQALAQARQRLDKQGAGQPGQAGTRASQAGPRAGQEMRRGSNASRASGSEASRKSAPGSAAAKAGSRQSRASVVRPSMMIKNTEQLKEQVLQGRRSQQLTAHPSTKLRDVSSNQLPAGQDFGEQSAGLEFTHARPTTPTTPGRSSNMRPSSLGKMSLVQRARASAAAAAGFSVAGGSPIQDSPPTSRPSTARMSTARKSMVSPAGKESPVPSTRASTAAPSRPNSAGRLSGMRTSRAAIEQRPSNAGFGAPVNSALRNFTEVLLESYQDLESAYAMIDLGGEGKITLSEFRAACSSMGFEGDAKSVFQALDTGKTGVIGKKDFAQLLRYAELLQEEGEDEANMPEGFLAEQRFSKPPNVARASLMVGLQG